MWDLFNGHVTVIPRTRDSHMIFMCGKLPIFLYNRERSRDSDVIFDTGSQLIKAMMKSDKQHSYHRIRDKLRGLCCHRLWRIHYLCDQDNLLSLGQTHPAFHPTLTSQNLQTLLMLMRGWSNASNISSNIARISPVNEKQILVEPRTNCNRIFFMANHSTSATK